MPVYEYKCKVCGAVGEFLEKPCKGGKRVCPECREGEMVKQVSSFSCRSGERASAGRGACPTGMCPYS